MTPRLMRFVATFPENARRTFSVIARTNSSLIVIVQLKRGGEKKNRNEIRGGDMEGRGSSTPGRPDKIIFFFQTKRKESCVGRGSGREGETEGERVGGV